MKAILIFCLCLGMAMPLSAQIPTGGLVAYYPFTGNANDASGNGNNGTVVGATLTADRFGNPNRAYAFDQTSAYIQVPDAASLRLTTQASFSFWMNIASDINYSIANGGPNIFSKGATPTLFSDYAFLLLYGQNQFESVNGSNIPTYDTLGSPLEKSTWIHICLVYQSGTISMYKNGVFIAQKPTNSTLHTSTGDLFIGCRYVLTGGGKFKGTLDDFRIYNRAVNSTEIQALANEPNPQIPTNGLVAYYPFTGNANDMSGNSNSLTVNNASLVSDRFNRTGHAYGFNGTDAYLARSGGISFTSDFTMSAWIKPDAFGSWSIVVAVGENSNPSNNVRLSYNGGTSKAGFDAYINGNTGVVNSSRSIPVGEWTHVAGVRKGSSWKLYINGELDSNFVGSTATMSNLNLAV